MDHQRQVAPDNFSVPEPVDVDGRTIPDFERHASHPTHPVRRIRLDPQDVLTIGELFRIDRHPRGRFVFRNRRLAIIQIHLDPLRGGIGL
jgi:hypothetical protein